MLTVVVIGLLAGCGSQTPRARTPDALQAASTNRIDTLCKRAEITGEAIIRRDLRQPDQQYDTKELEAAARTGLSAVVATISAIRSVPGWTATESGPGVVQNLERSREGLQAILDEVRRFPESTLIANGQVAAELMGDIAVSCGPAQEGALER